MAQYGGYNQGGYGQQNYGEGGRGYTGSTGSYGGNRYDARELCHNCRGWATLG